MQQVAERSLIVHVSLPGQHPGAPDLQSDYPSMQELSEGVLAILNLLQLGQVIVLGVGAGANILARYEVGVFFILFYLLKSYENAKLKENQLFF